MSFEGTSRLDREKFLNSSIKREKYSRKGGPLHERQIGLKTQEKTDLRDASPKNHLIVEIKNKRTDLELLQDERDQLLAYKKQVQKEQSHLREDVNFQSEQENHDPNTLHNQFPDQKYDHNKNSIEVTFNEKFHERTTQPKNFMQNSSTKIRKSIDMEEYRVEILNLANYLSEKLDRITNYEKELCEAEEKILDYKRKNIHLKCTIDEMESLVNLKRNQKERLNFYVKYNNDFVYNNSRYNTIGVELRRRLQECAHKQIPDNEYLQNMPDSDKERIVFCLPEVRIVGGLLLDIMIRDIHKKRCKGFFDVLREKCFYFYEKRAEVARDNLVNYAKNKTNANNRFFFNELIDNYKESYDANKIIRQYSLQRSLRQWKSCIQSNKQKLVNARILGGHIENVWRKQKDIWQFLFWRNVKLSNWRQDRIQLLMDNALQKLKRKISLRFNNLRTFAKRTSALKELFMYLIDLVQDRQRWIGFCELKKAAALKKHKVNQQLFQAFTQLKCNRDTHSGNTIAGKDKKSLKDFLTRNIIKIRFQKWKKFKQAEEFNELEDHIQDLKRKQTQVGNMLEKNEASHNNTKRNLVNLIDKKLDLVKQKTFLEIFNYGKHKKNLIESILIKFTSKFDMKIGMNIGYNRLKIFADKASDLDYKSQLKFIEDENKNIQKSIDNTKDGYKDNMDQLRSKICIKILTNFRNSLLAPALHSLVHNYVEKKIFQVRKKFGLLCILKYMRKKLVKLVDSLNDNGKHIEQENWEILRKEHRMKTLRKRFLFSGWRNVINTAGRVRIWVSSCLNDSLIFKQKQVFMLLKKYKDDQKLNTLFKELEEERIKYYSTQQSKDEIENSLHREFNCYDNYHTVRQKTTLVSLMRKWANVITDKRKSALRKLYENKTKINKMRLFVMALFRFFNTRERSSFREIILHSLRVKEGSTLRILKDNRILKDSLKFERESLNEQLIEFYKSKQSLESSKPQFIKQTKNVLNNFIVTKLYGNISSRSSQCVMGKLFTKWKTELFKRATLSSLIKDRPYSNLQRAFKIWKRTTCDKLQKMNSVMILNSISFKYHDFFVKSAFKSIKMADSIDTRQAISFRMNHVYEELYTNLKKNFSIRLEVLFFACSNIAKRLKANTFKEIYNTSQFNKNGDNRQYKVCRLLRKKRLYDLFYGLKHQTEMAIQTRQKVMDMKKRFLIKQVQSIINVLKSQVVASKCYKFLAMKLQEIFNKRKRSYRSYFFEKFNEGFTQIKTRKLTNALNKIENLFLKDSTLLKLNVWNKFFDFNVKYFEQKNQTCNLGKIFNSKKKQYWNILKTNIAQLNYTDYVIINNDHTRKSAHVNAISNNLSNIDKTNLENEQNHILQKLRKLFGKSLSHYSINKSNVFSGWAQYTLRQKIFRRLVRAKNNKLCQLNSGKLPEGAHIDKRFIGVAFNQWRQVKQKAFKKKNLKNSELHQYVKRNKIKLMNIKTQLMEEQNRTEQEENMQNQIDIKKKKVFLIICRRRLKNRYLEMIRHGFMSWYDETYYLGYNDFITPELIYHNLDIFQDMLMMKQQQIDELNNKNGYLHQSIEQISDVKIELMRVLKDKERLSVSLSEKTDEVEKLAVENERQRNDIDSCRNEARELISTGMSYIEYTGNEYSESGESFYKSGKKF